jgi:hypothetical protein
MCLSVAIDIAGVAPSELTDAQLVKACSSPQVQGGDIIILKGAVQLHDVQCLAPLEQMHAFDISGCTTIKAAAVATGVAAAHSQVSTKRLHIHALPVLPAAHPLAAIEPCVNSKKLEAKYLQKIRSGSANLLFVVLFYYKGCCVLC